MKAPKSKHTSGSWRLARVAKHGHPIAIVNGEGKRIAVVPEDDTLETRAGRIVEFVSPEGEANAALIASAPALLYALRELVRACDAATPRGSGSVRISDALDEADRAIAEAESR